MHPPCCACSRRAWRRCCRQDMGPAYSRAAHYAARNGRKLGPFLFRLGERDLTWRPALPGNMPDAQLDRGDLRAALAGRQGRDHSEDPLTKMSVCRVCASPLSRTFADLGMSPLANSYIKLEKAKAMEPFYPLHVYVCERCLLVQLEEFESPQHIFSDYAYFSSFSDAWLKHANEYVDLMIERFGFGLAISGRGDRQQRRVPVAVFPRAGRACAWGRARDQRR